MKKLKLAVLAFAALAFAAPALARPIEPWTNADNERKSDAGEILYRCGTDDRGPKVQIDQAQIDRLIQEGRFQAGGQIPVYFHVITSGSSGNVPESQLDQQIVVLNRNYAGKDYNGNTVSGAANTRLHVLQGRQRPDEQPQMVAHDPGLERRGTGQERPRDQSGRRPQHLPLQPRPESPRLGRVPVDEPGGHESGRRGDPLRVPSGRHAVSLQPGRDGVARGRPLPRPVSHVPGGL